MNSAHACGVTYKVKVREQVGVGSLGIHLASWLPTLPGLLGSMVHKASMVPSERSPQGRLLGKARLGWWVGPGQHVGITAVG